ncbi:MAG: GNAT family N-acetyltransferase [Gaiellaceae bacterium]
MTEEVTAAAFLALRSEIRDLWPAASRRRIDDILPRHAERAGFRAVIERGPTGALAGFATLYWSWDTLIADRIGVMHDLFVVPDARGSGVAEALIDACRAECRRRGAAKLTWQTARDNHRAQRVYDRIGAERDEWLDYSLPAGACGGEE